MTIQSRKGSRRDCGSPEQGTSPGLSVKEASPGIPSGVGTSAPAQGSSQSNSSKGVKQGGERPGQEEDSGRMVFRQRESLSRA